MNAETNAWSSLANSLLDVGTGAGNGKKTRVNCGQLTKNLPKAQATILVHHYSNRIITISGLLPTRSGGPQVPTPHDV